MGTALVRAIGHHRPDSARTNAKTDEDAVPHQRLIGTIERMSSTARLVTALVLVGLIAVVDALTGAVVALSVSYLLPVALATAPDRVGLGYALALAAAVASVIGDVVQDPARAPIAGVRRLSPPRSNERRESGAHGGDG